MSITNISSEALLLVSGILSLGIGTISYKVFKRNWATQECLLVWYTVLAGVALLTTFVVCGTREPGDADFSACVVGIAPWFLLLAAHALMLVVFIDRNKRSLLANLLSAALVFAAAYIHLFENFELIVVPAIAIVTVPLMTVIHKCDQEMNSDNQKTCCTPCR